MNNPIVNVSLVDQIYTDIKRKILLGTFAPNLKLTTSMLCDIYKVSDTPIKQALNRLVSDGLVEATPRRGMRVSIIDEKKVSDAYKARLMIELYAIPYIMEKSKSNPSFIEELEQLIKEHERIVSSSLLDTYNEDAQYEIDLSFQFHLMLVETTQNDIIISMYKNITNYTYIYYRANLRKSEEIRLSLSEHRDILQCIKNLNAEELRNALELHLNKRLDKIQQML